LQVIFIIVTSDNKNDDIEKIQKQLNEIKEKEKKLKNELKIAKENEKNENIKKKYEKFKDSDDLNIQVKILDEIEDDLKILKEKNVKNIDNIINKITIRKREKSVNDSDDNDDNDKIKPRFKEYKIEYNELNQTVIGKNAITFLEKKTKECSGIFI
jgi:hypothetical protein